MATSDFVITLTFTGADQAEADQRRDDALQDFALLQGLNIYTDATRQEIDPLLIPDAVEEFVINRAKAQIKAYRQQKAAQLAAAQAGTEADAELAKPVGMVGK